MSSSFWGAKPHGDKYEPQLTKKQYNHLAKVITLVAGTYKPATKLGQKTLALVQSLGRKAQEMTKSKKTKKAVIHREGVMRTEQQSGKKRKRTKKKVSLRKKVNTLMKNMPKSSKLEFEFAERYKQPKAGGPGRGRLFEIEMFNQVLAKQAINDLSGVDFSAIDSNVLFKNLYFEYHMTNAVTCNTEIEYFWVQCKDTTSLSYLDDWRAECVERGITPTSSVSSAVAANFVGPGFQSKYPRRITTFLNERFIPITTGLKYASHHWRQISPVYKTRLGPGDDIKITHSMRRFSYKDEQADQSAGISYLKGMNIHLIIKTNGMWAHDQTNVDCVSSFDTAQDCCQRVKWTVVYSDGEGRNVIDRINDLANQGGVSVPVQAEDKASAVEFAED